MALIMKEGVRLVLVPQLLEALKRIDDIYTRFSYPAIVTSANDGTHSPNSLHYIGAAVDLRTKGLDAVTKSGIVAALKSAFPTPPWFVQFEFPNQPQEHIHLQHGLAIYDRLKNKFVGYSFLPQ